MFDPAHLDPSRIDQTSPAYRWLTGEKPSSLPMALGVVHFVRGVPPAALGANDDYAFRFDGAAGANTTIYHKQAGAWVGLTA